MPKVFCMVPTQHCLYLGMMLFTACVDSQSPLDRAPFMTHTSDRCSVDSTVFEAIRNFLNQHATIRIWISHAPGAGHQAATIRLMDRIRELGYEGSLEAIYDARAAGSLLTIIDGFDPKQKLNFLHAGKTTLQSSTHFAPGDLPELDLGMTAGWEVSALPNMKLIRVKTCILLSPLHFPHNASQYASVANQIWHREAATKILPELYNKPFVYRVPSPKNLKGALAKAILSSHLNRQQAQHLLAASQVSFMPVYGTHATQNGIAQVLILAKSVGKTTRSHPERFPQGASIIVLSEHTDYEWAWFKEAIQSQKEIRFFESNVEFVEADWQEVRAQKKVSVLRLGPVPQTIYETLYAQASLPLISGGSNTTNLARLLGKPYMETAQVSTFPSIQGFSEEQQIAERATHTLAWIPENPAQSAHSVDAFIAQSLDPQSSMNQYFSYINPSRDPMREDKLVIALRGLLP